MLAKALERMPHAGPMRLIAAIEAADESRIRCIATNHSGPDYPLRLSGVLYAASLVEIGAQAAAAHASVFGIGAAHTGLVLTIGDLSIERDLVECPDPLVVTAERLRGMDAAAAYRFTAEQNGGVLASGELLLSMREAGG